MMLVQYSVTASMWSLNYASCDTMEFVDDDVVMLNTITNIKKVSLLLQMK